MTASFGTRLDEVFVRSGRLCVGIDPHRFASDGIDEFLPAQKSDHAIVGVEQGLPAGWSLRVEAYRKDYRDLLPRFRNLDDAFDMLVKKGFIERLVEGSVAQDVMRRATCDVLAVH